MKRRHSQSGYALLIILIMVTLLSIALAAAVPAIKTQIRREQEIELQHRGDQYVRAIQTYYHKFGRYPNSIDQLVSTNNLHFLRKRYKDPMTGKDDWRIIHMGEAKYPPKIKGAAAGQVGQQLGQNIGTGAGSNIGSNIGSNANSTSFSLSANNANSAPGPAGSANPDYPAQTAQPGAQPAGGLASGSSNGSTGSSIGQSGQPMIGVAIPSTHDSLKVYNERKKYNEWEFIYDPRIEALKNSGAGGGVSGGVPGSGLPNNGGLTSPSGGTMGAQMPQPVQPQNPQ